MAALAKNVASQKVFQDREGKTLKYEYRVNINTLIDKLKVSMVLMLLEDNPEIHKVMLYKIVEEISQKVVPIRPG